MDRSHRRAVSIDRVALLHRMIASWHYRTAVSAHGGGVISFGPYAYGYDTADVIVFECHDDGIYSEWSL